VNGPPNDRETSDLEALDPIEDIDDARVTRDRSLSGLSKQTTSIIVLGTLIAMIGLIVLVGTRGRGGHKQSGAASMSVAVSTSVAKSTMVEGPQFHYFGTLHTRLGVATMVCGEEGMPVCGTGTDLEFVACPNTLAAYFGGLYQDAATEKRVVELIHRQPPSGMHWGWGCGRDFRGGVLHTG
jgi:hypothetical protein